jgi:hypothetical protein
VVKIARLVNGTVRRFNLECPRDKILQLRHAIVGRKRENLLKAVKLELETQLASEWERISSSSRDDSNNDNTNTDAATAGNEPCLGDCGAMSNVRIVKRCSTCEERDECRCDPAWCHQCLLKWWIEKVLLLSYTHTWFALKFCER